MEPTELQVAAYQESPALAGAKNQILLNAQNLEEVRGSLNKQHQQTEELFRQFDV